MVSYAMNLFPATLSSVSLSFVKPRVTQA
jgi:hypothetical protein